MSLLLHLPAYSILDRSQQAGSISPATVDDMPSNWSFKWSIFWSKLYAPTEAIVKLNHDDKLLGLVHFGLFPSRTNEKIIECAEIISLETLPREARSFNPAAIWLIWYVSSIAIDRCIGNSQGHILVLVSVETAINFYRDQVKMEGLGWTTIAPGEDGYAFAFSQTTAKQFCTDLCVRYGIPEQQRSRF